MRQGLPHMDSEHITNAKTPRRLYKKFSPKNYQRLVKNETSKTKEK
jgi:hypothetical protein